MSKKAKLGVAFAVAAAFTVMAPVANAATYTYSGNLFTNVVGTYLGIDEITGYFRVGSLLPASATTNVTPDNWSFTDGQQTLNKSNSTASFSITTDAANNVIGWAVSLATTSSNIGTILTSFNPLTNQGSDQGQSFDFGTFTGGKGTNTDQPGEWTTAVPVPASLPLLASGIGGLIYLGRGRRKAKAGYKIAA